MIRSTFATLLLCVGVQFCQAQEKDYPFSPVNFTQVHLSDNFWMPRIKINHTNTIPTSFERCEKTGRVRNFDMAADKMTSQKTGKFCTTFPFDDTDIYKTIEGASFSLSLFPDKKLEAYIDSLINIVGKAQEPDGYLYTARTIDPSNPHNWSGSERWVKERELSHELYNAGHLYESAAAHFYATGKKNLLNIALKNADLVCSVFGPNKKHVAPGHEIVEMGLVKLYRITGKKEYLETAKDFIMERGRYTGYDATSKDPWKNGSYWQDNIPVTQQREILGHSVRAGYLYAAVADIAALADDKALLTSIDSLWDNLVSKKIYVQGGAGAIPDGERYGGNYELPNATAYNETCAAISNVYWSQRMFQIHGESKYIDLLEKILYNGLISGLAMDGKTFFYTNALQVTDHFSHRSLERERSGWFECSCCPTNLSRLIPSIPGYVYAQKGNDLFVNLFISSNTLLKVGGKDVEITQKNNYPWDGDLTFNVSPLKGKQAFALKVRIPGWAQGVAIASDLYSFVDGSSSAIPVLVNGQPVQYKIENGYAVIDRVWNKKDVVEVKLPMDIKRVKANEKLTEDIGKVALQRGPLMYCAEWPDNNGKTSNIILPSNAVITASFQPELLNGVMVLKSEAKAVMLNDTDIKTQAQPFVAIPYYAWAHRGKGEMQVWFPEKVSAVDILSH